MKNGFIAVAALAVVAAIGGCSSSPSQPPPPGALPPDTAHVTVNGQSAGTMRNITCSQVDQYTNIDTGNNNNAGVSAVVESVQGGFKLAAKSVQIRNLGGFNGSYWDGIIGNAEATATGNTYTITGTADGFNADKPDTRATATFQIKASC